MRQSALLSLVLLNLALAALPAAADWQTPGEVKAPTGPWLKPGEIQKPGDIQVVKEKCTERLEVAADTLFAFDKDQLTDAAQATLANLVTQIHDIGHRPTEIAGHTDSIGSDAYNLALSERRAANVKVWLVAHDGIPAATPIRGYGKRRPVAANTKPDGSDDPDGRQKNRRVEVVIDTCH